MMNPSVYTPEQYAKVCALHTEVDQLWRQMVALNQQKNCQQLQQGEQRMERLKQLA